MNSGHRVLKPYAKLIRSDANNKHGVAEIPVKLLSNNRKNLIFSKTNYLDSVLEGWPSCRRPLSEFLEDDCPSEFSLSRCCSFCSDFELEPFLLPVRLSDFLLLLLLSASVDDPLPELCDD